MANTYKTKQLKSVKSNISKALSNKTTSSNNMSSKISNYEKRLSSIGVNTEETKDTRNPIEKFFNVKQDQNVLFDIFEVLGRPQQALFGGIEAVQQGGDFFEGAKENWEGNDTTNFGDILRNAGMSDAKLFTNPITQEDTSLADVLGLAGDIFLDPLDIPLFAVKPLTTATKGANIVDTAVDAARATKNTLAPFQKGSKSLLELGAGALAKGVKKGVGLTDNLVTKGLTKIDDINLQKMINAGEDVSKFVGKSDAYKAIKKSLGRTTDYASSIPDNLYSTITRSDNALDAANAFGTKMADDISKNIKKLANETGLSEDYIRNAIKTLRDSTYKPSQTASQFLVDAVRSGENTFRGSKDEITAIRKAFEDFKDEGFIDPITMRKRKITDDVLNINISRDGKSLTIKTTGKGSSKLNNLIGNDELMKKLDDITMKKSSLSDLKSASKEVRNEVLHDILDAKKLYNDNELFRNIYKQSDDAYKNTIGVIADSTGGKVDLSNINRPGYTRTSATEEGSKALNILENEGINYNQMVRNATGNNANVIGNKKAFSEKTFSPFAKVANEQFSETKNLAKQTRLNRIESLKANLHDSKVIRAEELLNKTNKQISELTAQYAKNRAIVIKNSNNVKNAKMILDSKIDDLDNIITNDVLEKVKNIDNDSIVTSLVKKTDNYNSKVARFESLKAQLNTVDLTKSKAKSLSSKLEKAYKSMQNAKADVIIQTEKVINGIDDKFVKEAKSVAKKVTNDLTKNIKSQSSKATTIKKLEQTKKFMRQGFDSELNNLKRLQSNYALDLKTLLSKSSDAINKADKKILDEIGKLQKEIDILDNIDVQEVFSGDFLKGFGDFVNTSTTQAKAINTYNEVLLHSGMKNDKVLKFVGKGETINKSDIIGMKKLTQNDINKMDSFLEKMKNFIPKDSNLIKEHRNIVKNSNSIYMDEDLYDLIHLSDFSETKLKPVVNMLNNYNNFFKKYSTLTPGFHLRNISGNATNMILSGVPVTQIPGLYTKANKLGNSKYIMELITKNGKGSLNAAEAADYKIIKQFIEGGFAGTGKEVRDLGEIFAKATTNNDSKNLLKKSLDKIFELNVKGNEFVDARNRMALLLYANKNPKYITKLGANDAIDAVKKVLFDPKNMSPFEQKYIKKIIPFYTFTKQNLIFQANNLIANTSKYNRLFKTFNKAYDAVGEENYRQYQKENFELPVSLGDDGLTTMKLNLPVGDLGEYLENPLHRLVSSTSPLIKTPFELTSGVDTFTGHDISDRSGLETLARSLGLTNIYNATGNIFDLATGETEITPATVAPSIFRYTDAEKIANQREYEELIQYQQIVKDLKSQGIDVPTIKELTTSTNANLRSLKQRRDKLLKRRSS